MLPGKPKTAISSPEQQLLPQISMVTANSVSFQQFQSQFATCINSQHTCKLQIDTSTNQYWCFYFRFGNLVWATGSHHRFRRFYRIINQFEPKIDCNHITLREKEISELWEYLVIKVLYQRQKLDLQKVNLIIEAMAKEILFDCFQSLADIVKINYFTEKDSDLRASALKNALIQEPITYINGKQTFKQAHSLWDSWTQAGFASISPNLCLSIKNQEKLKSSTDDNTYQRLSILMEYENTLRDFAVTTNKDLLILTKSLIAYLNQSMIELKDIDDVIPANYHLRKITIPPTTLSKYQNFNQPRRTAELIEQPLIACIDDSPLVCQKMSNILNPAGYRTVNIYDSIQALSLLVKYKYTPDLIFLDLVMPVLDGYELCSKIRKMEVFKNTPIIILTGKDGVIDRVKAKMVGASGFLNKNIDQQKILNAVEKCLKMTNS